jgi:hypothetical protein
MYFIESECPWTSTAPFFQAHRKSNAGKGEVTKLRVWLLPFFHMLIGLFNVMHFYWLQEY